ncbi:hypothetical protein BS17DRAFT_772871 [Gyrodon lividus]|nr:hypothetical protein BS17DRAFT_772871 [Gyrodon lividus]
MAIGLPEVVLVSIFVEGCLYGVFGVLFFASMFVLLRRKNSREQINKPMICASIAMFVLSTVHVAADIQRLLEGFIYNPDPNAYLSQVNTPLYSLKSTAYAAQTLVGDGFVLYRLYLVWNGDKRVVLPIAICFVASIGVGIGALQGFARASPTAPIFITELHDWVVSFFSLTLFTNLSCTSLIASRILWVNRRTNIAVSGRNVVTAAVVIIESGAIYSCCLIILLSLYLSNSFAQYIMLDAVTQVIGVVFSLIIVRVGLGLSTDKTYQRTSLLTTMHTAPSSGPYRMNTVAVEITQDTHTDGSTTDPGSVKFRAL